MLMLSLLVLVALAAVAVHAQLLPPPQGGWNAHRFAEELREQQQRTRAGDARRLASLAGGGNGWGPEKAKQQSGYIDVAPSSGKGMSHLFYWFFEARNNPETAPLALWLTGGPGCSSMLALFAELGPYRMNETTGRVSINPYSWNTNANLIFLDSPVGTGFSYADDLDDYATDSKEMAYQAVEFLKAFVGKNTQYAKRDFYLFAESYGGHWAPAIASKIVADGFPVPLKGIGIGNGWVDPRVQYGQYAEFAYKMKFINEVEKAAFEASNKVCLSLIDSGAWPAALEYCSLQMTAVLEAISVHKGCQANVYDVRKCCEHPPLCYSFDKTDELMNNATVKEALGVPQNLTWTSCSMFVHTLLLGDWIADLDVVLPAVLKAGVRVSVYSGTEDFVCNYFGGIAWTTALQWPGQHAFVNAPLKPWSVNGKLAGNSRTANVPGAGRLEFVEVFNAGHMVPMDQPANALALFDTVVGNKDF